ncbi:hypothetical protein [Candidatus Nitrosocosmicus sp. T]
MNIHIVYAILIVFGIGCLIGTIPIIQNFPFPVGYDSINYYLPTLYNLNSNPVIGEELFPVYIFLVYIFYLIVFSDLYFAYNAVNIVLYGSFGVTTFLLIKNVLRQSVDKSILFAIFVMFQLSTLRMEWDLHRDILALVFLNLCLVTVNNMKSLVTNKFVLLQYVSISIIYVATIFSDRMIGSLLIVSSIFLSILHKLKILGVVNLLILILFLTYFLLSDDVTFVSIGSNPIDVLLNPVFNKNILFHYDLLVLHLSLNGILIPFFIIGFLKKSDSLTLKIPTFVTIMFSFSWLIVPNYDYLVPERWIILSGFFISIFGLYGFFLLVDRLVNSKLKNLISVLFIASFVTYGILFMILPYGIVFTIPSVFQNQTGLTFPLSMSFNSLEISKNQDLVKSIEWINSNTKNNSQVIGTMHWRGWFNLFLEKPRQYIFSETISLRTDNFTKEKNIVGLYNLLKSKIDSQCANKVETFTNSSSALGNEENIFLIDLKSGYYDTPDNHPIVYDSEYFNIYEITHSICG